MLPGWCWIAIAALEVFRLWSFQSIIFWSFLGTETADATCALSGSISGTGNSIEIRLRMCGPPLFQLYRFHFWDRKLNWNQASHVRASSVPTLYACCLTKRSCHFLFVARVGLCCWFCDFAVSFLVPPDGPKNGTVKVLFFCSFTKQCMRSQKWDRPIFVLGSFFEVFCIKVAEAQRFGFNEALWLMAAGRELGEQLMPHVRFQVPFLGPETQLKSGFACAGLLCSNSICLLLN